MHDPHDAIADVFRRFAAAVGAGDVEAFAALCVEDQPPEVEVFRDNSARMRAQELSLRIRSIDQDGRVAAVAFDVVNAGGAVVDEATLTMTAERAGWRIRAL